MDEKNALIKVFLSTLPLGYPALQFISPGDTVENSSCTQDQTREPTFAAREGDWRIGPVVYHVLVDRFAPPADPEAKRHLYAEPRRLVSWNHEPKRGKKIDSSSLWTHEVEFWGGDLESLRGKLDYIAGLGADVLYLNPIHLAPSNHKYDAMDFEVVSPEYGTREDVASLADDLHQRGMKLMLDGVFNHMGCEAPAFKKALSEPNSPEREWFYIGKQYDNGSRGWCNSKNLPELHIEHADVANHIYRAHDSVVQRYLREGVDGWRLDVAYDLGFNILSEITHAAHEAKAGSAVIGEIWNYPEQWFPAVDGVMNFHAREIVLGCLHGKLSGGRAGRLLERMIDDAGIEPILRSWMILDNHDTQRLATMLGSVKQRRLAQVLQFTLPGAPCVYYGNELGQTGGDDPANRGPMRWDLVCDDNETLTWTKSLIEMRHRHRALRLGDFRLLDSDKLLAFSRRTNRYGEFVIVIANPTSRSLTEVIPTRESKVMSASILVDQLSEIEVAVHSGMIEPTVPAHSAMVLTVKPTLVGQYSPYKRVH